MQNKIIIALVIIMLAVSIFGFILKVNILEENGLPWWVLLLK